MSPSSTGTNRLASSLEKIEEARSQLSQALLAPSCVNSYTVGRLLGSGDDHIAILAWKKPEGNTSDSPQHLIPRVMKFIRRGSPNITCKGLAKELHARWKLSVHPHMLKLGDVFATPDYLVIGMEYANAKSLRSILAVQRQAKGARALPYPLAVFFFQQLVLTMEFCNQNGVHFRDLQPKYVLISRDKQGNPLVKLGAGGFSNTNDEVKEVATSAQESAWRAAALYAPPEDLEQWLRRLNNPSNLSRSTSVATASCKRMTRHQSHSHVATLESLITGKRQHSTPALGHRRTDVLRRRSRLSHQGSQREHGTMIAPLDTQAEACAPQPHSSSRCGSRVNAEHAVRSTQHAAQRMLRSNSAKLAAAAAAAAAAFGSEMPLTEPDGVHGTCSALHSTADVASGTNSDCELTLTSTRHMHSPQNRADPPGHRAPPSAGPVGEGNASDSGKAYIVVGERASPFFPPASEPCAPPMHASRGNNIYTATAPVAPSSADLATRRTVRLKPVPSFNEWGSDVVHSENLDTVDPSAASVWAAGCMLFEMLYGYHPFEMEAGESMEEWVAKVQSLKVRWPESVPDTDECRRALSAMLAPHTRRMSLVAVRNLAFFRRDLPEGAFDMTAHANARVAALRPQHVQDVISRLHTLVDTCRTPRLPTQKPRHQPSVMRRTHSSCHAASAHSSGLLCGSPASSA